MHRYKNKLKELRTKKGISQAELSGLMKVDQRTISAWEVGRNLPKPYQMSAFEDFFEVPKEQIFFEAFNYKHELKITN